MTNDSTMMPDPADPGPGDDDPLQQETAPDASGLPNAMADETMADTTSRRPSAIPADVRAASTMMGTLIGRSLGDYRIVGMLGAGGMGVVYRGHDTRLERDVAIKVLPAELASDASIRERFLAEARCAGKLMHPHVVPIHAIGEQDGIYFIVMELIMGGAVDGYLETHGAYSIAEATQIAIDACRGIAAAHELGLIHRDLKPANLLRTANNTVKVADFGLVKASLSQTPKLTASGVIMGTPDFMSPEQCQAQEVDIRTDVYSLGGTYYALLTARPPYGEMATMAKLYAHCHQEPPDPREVDASIPASCAKVIRRAMAKDPADRYPDVNAMCADLVEILRIEEASAPRKPELVMGDGDTGFASAPTASAPISTTLTMPVRSAAAVAETQVAAPAATPTATAPPTKRGRGGIIAGVVVALIAIIGGLLWHHSRHPDTVPPAAGITGELVFGSSTAFSGPNGGLGQAMAAGIRARFAEANAEGGVHGKTLSLVVLDDGYEPARALANMQELVEERRVFATVGNVGTPTALVTVPYALEHKHLFFAPFTGAAFLRQEPPDRYVFNYRASYADETAAMVRYFTEMRGVPAEAIAVFAQADGFGDDGFQGVADALRAHGVREDAILRVGYERNTLKIDAAVAAIRAAPERAQAIVMVSTYAATARFVTDLRQAGIQSPVGAVSFVGSDLLAAEFQALGANFGDGVIVTQVVPHFDSQATGVIRYRRALATHVPEAQPSFVSLEGYIAASILVDGLRRAGPDASPEDLIDGLETIRNLDLGIGPVIEFGPSRHQGSRQVWGTRLTATGTYTILDLTRPTK